MTSQVDFLWDYECTDDVGGSVVEDHYTAAEDKRCISNKFSSLARAKEDVVDRLRFRQLGSKDKPDVPVVDMIDDPIRLKE